MRLTSEMFAAYLVRRVFADGGFAAVVRRGADAAGAVFVVLRDRQGAIRLLGPTPTSGWSSSIPKGPSDISRWSRRTEIDRAPGRGVPAATSRQPFASRGMGSSVRRPNSRRAGSNDRMPSPAARAAGWSRAALTMERQSSTFSVR